MTGEPFRAIVRNPYYEIRIFYPTCRVIEIAASMEQVRDIIEKAIDGNENVRCTVRVVVPRGPKK